jgi:hypothetical protein
LNVGEENFIEASELIDPRMIQRLEVAARKQREVEDAIRERATQTPRPMIDFREPAPAPAHVEAHPLTHKPPSHASTAARKVVTQSDNPFGLTFPVTDESQRTCLSVMLDYFGHFNEIFVSPFLRKLSDALPRLADYERKALLNDLEAAGAIRIEKRRGEPYDYSVIVVNYNHPTVRELNP